MKLEHFLIPYTKINSRQIKDLNVRPETIKLLEENTGKTLFDINPSKTLFDFSLLFITPRVMKIKTKIKKWDLIKFKSFCTAKETLNKMKRQPSEWEKIIKKEANVKSLIPKIYKQFAQPTSEKQTTESKKWVEDQNRHFSKDDTQRANKQMKRYSTSLIIREMQIKLQ